MGAMMRLLVAAVLSLCAGAALAAEDKVSVTDLAGRSIRRRRIAVDRLAAE